MQRHGGSTRKHTQRRLRWAGRPAVPHNADWRNLHGVQFQVGVGVGAHAVSGGCGGDVRAQPEHRILDTRRGCDGLEVSARRFRFGWLGILGGLFLPSRGHGRLHD